MKTQKSVGTVKRRAVAPAVERWVPVAQPVRVLDEGELAAALDVAEDNALWLAVNQLLRDHLDEVRSQVSTVEAAKTPGVLAHCAGGMEWLGYFQAELAARRSGAAGRALSA